MAGLIIPADQQLVPSHPLGIRIRSPFPSCLNTNWQDGGGSALSSFLLQQQTSGSRGSLALPSSWAREEYGPRSSLPGVQTFLAPLLRSSELHAPQHQWLEVQRLKMTAGMPGRGQVSGSPRRFLLPSDQYFHHV